MSMQVHGVFRNADSTRTVSAGGVVFEEGASGSEMYGVIDGEVELRTGHGKVFTVGPYETFGEMALVDNSPRMATAVAVKETTLAVIDQRTFLFLVHETPTFALQVMSSMAARLRSQG
jgi:CRP-like cAMP-binding protein